VTPQLKVTPLAPQVKLTPPPDADHESDAADSEYKSGAAGQTGAAGQNYLYNLHFQVHTNSIIINNGVDGNKHRLLLLTIYFTRTKILS
jgi:hypothetical protein